MNNIPCQAYAIKYAGQYVKGFPYVPFHTLRRIFELVHRHGNGTTICQELIAKEIGCSSKSVYRAFALFRRLGWILTKRRFNNSCYVTLTKFFTFPTVRQALSRIFKYYPQTILTPFLLLTGNVPIEDYGSNPDRTGYLEVFSIEVSSTKGVKKRPRGVSEVDQNAVRKVLSIEETLIKRGELRENMDVEKLAGFPEECLDAALAKMRTAKVKEPFRFFMHLCWKWCTDNNREPNFAVADYLREHDILSKYRALSKPGPARTGYVNKQGDGKAYIKQEIETIAKKQEEHSKSNLANYQRRNTVKAIDKTTVNPNTPLMKEMFNLGQIMLDKMEDQWSPEAMILRREFEEWGIPYVLRTVGEPK